MDEDKKVIETSSFFNATWYEAKYCVPIEPADHYLRQGWMQGFDPSKHFSTREYLQLNPDVAMAKMNPLLHYEQYGRKEGRIYSFDDIRSVQGARFRRATEQCNLTGKGLEIGPSFNPICPKRKGYNIDIMDHLDADGLRKKYANDANAGNLVWQIEEVDYVWSGEDYRKLIGKENYYDYILASHLIEHTTDFVGFLEQCSALLKEGGVLSLIVPNKHCCFDFFRECTSLGQVLEKYANAGEGHGLGAIAEYLASVVSLDGHIAWNKDMMEKHRLFEFMHTKEDVLRGMKTQEFLDIHEWVFTPGSFRILINDLRELGFIDLHEESFYVDERNTCEFYISLKKDNIPINLNTPFDQARRRMLYQYKLQEDTRFYLDIMKAWEENAQP